MPGSIQPIRLSDHLMTTSASDSSHGGGPRQSHKDASDSWSFSSGFSKDTAMDAWASLGGHNHHSPPHVKATMKTINRGSYLPSQTATSTSKIVDQALHVVKSHAAALQRQQRLLLQNQSFHEPQPEQDDLPPSLMASEMSFSSIDTSGRSSATSRSSGTSTCGGDNPAPLLAESLGDCPEPADTNVVPPSLRKIAKKRRKENDEAGLDRSSFHHTKSSKEYLRKAQEALIIRDQLDRGEQSDDSRGAPLPLAKEVAERLLSGAPSVFARRGPVRPSLHNPTWKQTSPELENCSPPPRTSSGLSRSQSCDDFKTTSSSVRSQPSSSQSDDDCNPYGYEDPDAVAAPAPSRRTGMARRRGSVTKFSLKAAEHAKEATERIMKLQGLKVKPESPGRSPERRSATPTGRRRHPRLGMGMTSGGTHESRRSDPSPMDAQIRQRSIPLGDWDTSADNVEKSNYGYEDLAMNGDRFSAGVTAPSVLPCESEYPYDATTTSLTDPHGNEDRDACADRTHSSPYGYENPDLQPQQPRRRHPRPTRRGSVTKFSFDAAMIAAAASESLPESTKPVHEKSTASSEFASSDASRQETEEDRVGDLMPASGGGLDVFLSTQSPYFVTSQSHKAGVNRNISSNSDAPNSADSLSRGILSPHQCTSPRRTGSYRRPHRFGAEGLRSDSFLSHGSGVSFDDDADSLAPDMESLCSIHDRTEDNDFPPLPPPVPAKSPVTPRMTPSRTRSGNSLRGGLCMARPAPSNASLSSEGFQLRPKRSTSGRTGTMGGVPLECEFAILPFAGSIAPAATSSENLMPAPVKRHPSNSVQRTSSNSSRKVPVSIDASLALPSEDVTVEARMGGRTSLTT